MKKLKYFVRLLSPESLASTKEELQEPDAPDAEEAAEKPPAVPFWVRRAFWKVRRLTAFICKSGKTGQSCCDLMKRASTGK